MSKELIYIRFLQYSVLVLTFLLFYSIIQAKKGNIELHKKINIGTLAICAVAVLLLVISVAMGFDYKSIPLEDTLLNFGPDSMKLRLGVHRSFSIGLTICLGFMTYTGLKNQGQRHKKLSMLTVFFWLGTLISAWCFF